MKPSLYAVAASLYLAEYTLYSNSSATVLLNASIADFFHVPYGLAANVGVAFLAGFCATLLPAGLLLHRCRPINTFYVSSAALAVLGIAASLSPSFGVLIAVRFLQGAVSAVLAPQLFRIARQQFYPDHHTAFLGTWGLVVSASALCSPLITAVLNDAWGWRAFPFETVLTTVMSIPLLAWGARAEAPEPDAEPESSRRGSGLIVGFGLAQVAIFLAVGATPDVATKVLLSVLATALGVVVIAACRSSARDGARRSVLYRSFLIVFVAGIATNVFTLVVIYVLQRVQSFSSYRAALVLVPMAAVAGLLPISTFGRPGDTAKNIRLVGYGAACLALAGCWVAVIADEVGSLLIGATAMGGAMGFLWSSLATNVLTNSGRVTFDSAVYHYLRALGAAIGVSVGATAIGGFESPHRLFVFAGVLITVVGLVASVATRSITRVEVQR
ncbi:MAG: MFS transporter [Mycolicibacterium sp.]|uniref:MFS transporter n=1 Tax=Mycolicibacterium sp. TaxID=2320850 RepID=UPI000F9F7FAC|nr:MFS transporter [Mycolicibacterium sp.]RUP26962.1 MAG: MFS transporter [Mycolicibacterium sp.]